MRMRKHTSAPPYPKCQEMILVSLRMASLRMCRLLFITFGVLKLCCAEELKCSTISNGTTTQYTIHQDHKYLQDNNDDDCDFSWYDNNDTVFANQESKSAMVKNWSINSLTTEGCHPAIFLKRNCISEGKEFIANCSASCDDSPKLPKDYDTPSNSTHLNYVNHIVVPLVVVSVPIVIAGILYMRQKNIFRNGCCGQMGGIYTDVKTNSNTV